MLSWEEYVIETSTSYPGKYLLKNKNTGRYLSVPSKETIGSSETVSTPELFEIFKVRN